ncbi:hypothetical protein FUA23_09355 [Neolewinella aurantiaca]|uniref:Uncharacterized protein n=1 Tax=Neolewinella aurantiaca TaxID=2602767 RepID=A0A5C7FXE5_9BACT|nr:hypothetical protein [Neolewinella aurantiaca]TXF89646.1 hypothetical protein FUA23_09355 [Neolewinella aurantiaca]
MIRSTLFSLFCLFALGFAVSSCDGDEVDLTNQQVDPPVIEVEAGTLNYTINGNPVLDTGFGFVCRTDTIGMLTHSYVATNVDVSGLSDTNNIVPVAQGDVLIHGYTVDVNDIDYTYLSIMVPIAVGELERAQCSDCDITMIETDGIVSGTFSGTVNTSNPDSVFVITDGTFELPLIELVCD